MQITIHKRELYYILAAVVVVAITYISRGVLMPFVVAAIVAYLLNPLVNFLTRRTKLPRTLVVSVIFLLIITGLTGTIATVWGRYVEESHQFTREAKSFLSDANSQVNSLPDIIRPIAQDLLESGRSSLLLTPRRITTFLPQAFGRAVSVLIFLMATFYFLKDGQNFISSIFEHLRADLRLEAETVIKKVNLILGNYLRAQLFLIAIMSTLTFIMLSTVGVRYAVLLSLFTGLAETVPFVGPVTAALLAMLVAYTDNYTRLNIDPAMQAVVVGLFYAIFRQIEDLFIIPQIMGRFTKLHPVVVLFATLLGGHLFGIIGFITAVPVVASLRVIGSHAHGLILKKDQQ